MVLINGMCEGAEYLEENGSDITFTYSEDGSYTWIRLTYKSIR